MRLLHTMLRVGDLDRSIAFYTDILGMQLLRRQDYPEGRFTLALSVISPRRKAQCWVTHNWDTTSYETGNGCGHIALGVPDAYAACDAIRAAGGKGGARGRADEDGSNGHRLVDDPDGYKIELIQRD